MAKRPNWHERLSFSNGLKVVQLSDAHLGSFDGTPEPVLDALRKVQTLEPDLILFTGDLVNELAALECLDADGNLIQGCAIDPDTGEVTIAPDTIGNIVGDPIVTELSPVSPPPLQPPPPQIPPSPPHSEPGRLAQASGRRRFAPRAV